MYLKIIITFLLIVLSNCLKAENEFLKLKIDVKLSKESIINSKNIGEDEILSGVFYGKTENIADKNFDNAYLECDLIGRSYQGRGFSCGFAVIEDLKGFCYIKNNNNEDILIVEWNCNTTAGINGDVNCAGKLDIIQGFGNFAGVSGFGEINMPIAKAINSEMSKTLNITLNIKYPMSLKK